MTNVRKAFAEQYGTAPAFVARAPGRVEFIGNHTDYNGGEVLGAAIDRFLWVAVSPRPDSRLHFASDGNPQTVSFADAAGASANAKGWVQYPVGVLSLLSGAGITLPTGFNFMVSSEIPSGAGLSSSAAFELASCIAFESLAGTALDRLERVRICRRAENEFVGVPCGILDQGVSGFGEQDRLVHIDCATEEIHTVAGPIHTRLWIFESGQKHSLVDSLYSERHRECREAFEGLRKHLPGIRHLVDVTAEQLQELGPALPDTVFRRARHIIEEHARVRACVRLLDQGDTPAVGRLLNESHWSSSKLFENSIGELDTLIHLLNEESAVFGARLTGGGFGGATMALCDESFSTSQAGGVAARFAAQYGHEPRFRSLTIASGATREDD